MLGSAVNPVLREGNSDRRALPLTLNLTLSPNPTPTLTPLTLLPLPLPLTRRVAAPVKAYAAKNPHNMGPA